MAKRQTDTIPKLDQVTYLFDTLGCVHDQLSFDAIRKALIALRPEDRESVKNVTNDTYWSNARDALRELMRIGLVNRSALPSRPKQLEVHKDRTFKLTDAGERFLDLEQTDKLEFRHRFAQALLLAHPYLREIQSLLASRELYFPRIQRSDLPGEVESWRNAPPEPLEQVGDWIATSMKSTMGLAVDRDRVTEEMRPYLIAAWKRLDREHKPHMFSKAIVKTFNDVIVRILLHFYGLRMDFVTFRSAVSLLSDLNVIWDTRSLLERRGWTLWGTSEIQIPAVNENESAGVLALEGPLWFRPRIGSENTIKDHLIETFLSFRDRKGGFAQIHALRAEVCHRLGLHGRTFDGVLRKMHAQEIDDSTYILNLDRGGGDEVPPSEKPFRIGNRAFYLITLLKRDTEEAFDGTA